jgi:translocation and assembly module TamB
VTEFVFATRASHLNATGTLGGSSANLKVTVGTTDIRELQPVIAALSGPAAFPLKIRRGQASFDGTLAGKLAQPTLFGHLKITDFDTLLAWRKNPLSKSETTAVSQLHWDVVETDLQLSPTAAAFRHGVLRRGASELNFEVTTALTNFQLTDHAPFRAELKLRQGDIAELEALAGYKYPLSGNVNLVLHLSGTRLYPNGEGNLLITNATAYGQPIDRLSTHLHFGNGELQLSDINATQSRAIVSGDATSNLGTGTFRFNLQGKGFDLASLKVRRSASLTVAGELSFTAAGSGTIDEPVINASLDVRNLVLGGEPEGNFHADAVTHGANLRLTTRSDFLHAQLDIEGGVFLRGEFPANLKVKFDRLDVDPLLHSFLKGRITGHSSTAGSLTLTGPLKRPRDLSIQGDLEQLLVDIENVRIQNDGVIRFAMTERTLRLERFHLVGEGTDISATGSAELAGSGRLNMKAVGRVNLKSIQTINPDYLSAGLMTIDLTVGGTPASPDLQGQAKVSDGALAYIDMPSGLSDINGTLAFNQDRLVVQSLTARTGGGKLNLGGFITYTRGLNFDLTAKGKDIRLRYPPGMSSTTDLDLHLVGSLTNSLLSGDILVTRFGMNRDFDFALYLARAKQPPQLANPDSPLSNLKFDLHITTTPELQVQTSLAKISGDADLHLRGTGTHPVVLGRANIAQGDVDFNGTKYHLERGEVLFTNPVRIEPVLDLEATARVRDYDITLGFHGPIDKLSTTYSSDPPLPTADIIALLAVGRTREETALQQQPQTGAMQSASNALLGEALNATTSNRLEKLFGVSRIKIDPQAGGAENNPSGTRVTIEQQVSNNLTLTYITNVSQTSQQIIQAEYYITKNISIIAVRDQNGVVGMDVRLRQRKK